MMTGADLLVELLKAQGVPFITTLSGNGLDPLFAACQRGGLRIIDFRNEQAAAYAADAYARLTKQIGVCAVSSGVAHVNAMAGVVNAYFDGAPLLLITGMSEQSHAGAGIFQDLDQVALAAPVCKYARLVDRADRIPFHLHEAISRAMLGRPGPVHLTIPHDVLAQGMGPLRPQDLPRERIVAQMAGAGDSRLVEEAADLLEKAQRPILIAGSGAFYAGAGAALDALATAMRLPVVVPIWDRGVIEMPAPYYMGVVGAASGEPRLLPDADLVLVVGAQVDYRVGYMERPPLAAEARVIRIDVDPETLHQGIEADVPIQGDPQSVLTALKDELAGRKAEPYSDWCKEARRRCQEFRGRWTGEMPPAPPMTGRHLIEALRPLLDDGTVFLIDGGNIGQWAHMLLGDRYPSHWLTCGASGVVGWGLGGAIAARLVFPERPVLLLSGDGSFGFTPAELETAVRHCTPFTAVVADDQAWGIVASGQLKRHDSERLVGCQLGPARYDLVAEGFGALGLRANGPEEILPAVRQGLASGRPTVVHVPLAMGGPAD